MGLERGSEEEGAVRGRRLVPHRQGEGDRGPSGFLPLQVWDCDIREENFMTSWFGYRFDMDHDDDVLYCYEIQLEECVRRKGLGV